VSFWLEMLIGLVVITLLVVLLGPGLWSSRVDINKPDDPKNKPPKGGT
jgi:competence protein ComGC